MVQLREEELTRMTANSLAYPPVRQPQRLPRPSHHRLKLLLVERAVHRRCSWAQLVGERDDDDEMETKVVGSRRR